MPYANTNLLSAEFRPSWLIPQLTGRCFFMIAAMAAGMCQSAGPKKTAGSKFEVIIIMVATALGAKKASNKNPHLHFYLGHLKYT
jgi:hypothetical protein